MWTYQHPNKSFKVLEGGKEYFSFWREGSVKRRGERNKIFKNGREGGDKKEGNPRFFEKIAMEIYLGSNSDLEFSNLLPWILSNSSWFFLSIYKHLKF